MSVMRNLPPPNLIDRAVAALSPQAGLARLRARAMLASLGGYEGGRRDRRSLRTWRPFAGSADSDTLPDLPDLRARTRDLARNVPIAAGAIATAVTNVIGDGLQLQASIDAAALRVSDDEADRMEAEHEREWALFCRTCDSSRIQHFDEMQGLVFRAVLESGDVLVVRDFRRDPGDVYGTKLKLIEADRLSNPGRAADSERLAGGVEIDGSGAPLAYHISDRHPGNLRTAGMTWQRLAARSERGVPIVLHLYDRLRPEQTRGIPYLAPVIEHLKQLGRYSEAEIAAAVINAMITAYTTTDADQNAVPLLGETDAIAASAAGAGAAANPVLDYNEVRLGSAAQIALSPGEKVEFPAPGRPNPAFDDFFVSMTRQIGVALEIPHELLIKHFTASYSASRAALEMAWQFFRKRRAFLARRLNQVVYEWMMEEAVASGRLNRPGFFEDPLLRMAWLGAEWIGPSRASIDPKREAEADEIDMRNGVKTGEQVCLERTGGEVEKKIAQLGKERRLKNEAGLNAGPSSAPDAAPADGQNQDGSDSDMEDETRQEAGR